MTTVRNVSLVLQRTIAPTFRHVYTLFVKLLREAGGGHNEWRLLGGALKV